MASGKATGRFLTRGGDYVDPRDDPTSTSSASAGLRYLAQGLEAATQGRVVDGV
jgi:hypothetical protein